LSKEEEVELKNKAVEIAKSLLSEYYIRQKKDRDHGAKGAEEDEEKEITTGNLRNLLMIAREAKEAGRFELFRIKAPYVARKADPNTWLWRFVENLIQQVDTSGYDDAKKATLAELVVTYAIYIYTAIDNGLGSVIYSAP